MSPSPRLILNEAGRRNIMQMSLNGAVPASLFPFLPSPTPPFRPSTSVLLCLLPPFSSKCSNSCLLAPPSLRNFPKKTSLFWSAAAAPSSQGETSPLISTSDERPADQTTNLGPRFGCEDVIPANSRASRGRQGKHK